jgi:hypothetical protein
MNRRGSDSPKGTGSLLSEQEKQTENPNFESRSVSFNNKLIEKNLEDIIS